MLIVGGYFLTTHSLSYINKYNLIYVALLRNGAGFAMIATPLNDDLYALHQKALVFMLLAEYSAVLSISYV